MFLSWIKSVYYYWFPKPFEGPLVRSEQWNKGMRKLLLEDLNSMKYKTTIDK